MDFAAYEEIGVCRQHRVTAAKPDAETQILPPLALEPHLNADFPPRQAGCEADPPDPCRRDLLDPHRLPNARRARIPDGVRLQLPVLFAARLGQVMRIVL